MSENPPWLDAPENIEDYVGFIYLIQNTVTGRLYVGKKFFHSKKTLPPLKGKKNRRVKYVESDWKTYWGSCKELLEDIKELGYNNFSRIILGCYKTKWECSYQEALYQMQENVLFRDDYYNGIINIRLSKAPKNLRRRF